MLVHPVQGVETEEEMEVVSQQIIPQPYDILEEVADNMDINDESQLPILQHHENFLPLEIPEDALMNEVEILEHQNNQTLDQGLKAQNEVFHNNIQLGMGRTFFNSPIPEMGSNLNPHGLAPNFHGLTQILVQKPQHGAKTIIEVLEAWVGFFRQCY